MCSDRADVTEGTDAIGHMKGVEPDVLAIQVEGAYIVSNFARVVRKGRQDNGIQCGYCARARASSSDYIVCHCPQLSYGLRLELLTLALTGEEVVKLVATITVMS
jgi:hypothetical protein